MAARTVADRVVSAAGGTVTVFLLALGVLLYWASWRNPEAAGGLAYGWAVVFLLGATFAGILTVAVARACRHG